MFVVEQTRGCTEGLWSTSRGFDNDIIGGRRHIYVDTFDRVWQNNNGDRVNK